MAGGGDPETAVLACCTWLCRLFVRSTSGRAVLSVGLRRTMVKQPTSIKISSSVRPTQSHILAESTRMRRALLVARQTSYEVEAARGGTQVLLTPRVAWRAAVVAAAEAAGAGASRQRLPLLPLRYTGATAALWQAPALACTPTLSPWRSDTVNEHPLAGGDTRERLQRDCVQGIPYEPLSKGDRAAPRRSAAAHPAVPEPGQGVG